MSTELTTEVDAETLVEGGGVAGSRAPTEAALPSAGDMLGRYEIEGELGRGGMGVVFAAFDPKLQRRVAIKLVIDRLRLQDIERITREAQAVARLSHPNVVQVFDVGAAGGLPYVVMEMIEGVTLAEWLKSTPRRREIVRVLIEAGQGLAAAHAVGLVHRDFKPANVLVDRRGAAKVLDFGLARPDGDSVPALDDGAVVHTASATLTETGIAVGTPAYMAPEQHRGERVGARADVYAFGVTLYEALAGRRPFAAGDAAMYYRLKENGAPRIDASEPLAERLMGTIDSALAFDPAERAASIDVVLGELRRARKIRARRGVWLLGVAITGLAAASYVVMREDSTAQTPAASVPQVVSVNLAEEEESLRLSNKARDLGFDRKHSDALGYGYAALLVARSSGSVRAHGRALRELGRSATKTPGGYELGQRYLEESVAVYERAESGASVVTTLVLASRQASYYGRTADAKTILRRAYAAAERYELLGDTGEHMELLMRSADIDGTSAEGASKFLSQAVAIFERSPGVGTPSMRAAAELHLGLSVLRTDLPRARGLLESSERRALEFAEPSHPAVTGPRLLLAEVYRQEDDGEACLAAADRLVESLPPDDPNAMRARLLQAACHYKLRHYAESEQISTALVELLRARPNTVAQQELLQNALQGRGIVLTALDRLEEADAVHQELLVLAESNPTPIPVTVAAAYYHLGNIAVLRKDAKRAEDYYRRGLEVMGERTHEMGASLRVRLGVLLVEEGHAKEGAPLLDERTSPGEAQASADERLIARAYRARARWDLQPDQRAAAIREARAALDEFAKREDEGFAAERANLEAWLVAHSN